MHEEGGGYCAEPDLSSLLLWRGWDACPEDTPCERCAGDCDNDSDCFGNLICLHNKKAVVSGMIMGVMELFIARKPIIFGEPNEQYAFEVPSEVSFRNPDAVSKNWIGNYDSIVDWSSMCGPQEELSEGGCPAQLSGSVFCFPF